MIKISLKEFIAEIETLFSNYSDTHDIDRVSIKTWVIEGLRLFGKNICDKNEDLKEIKKGKLLLPETFKSLIVALKVDPTIIGGEKEVKTLVNEKVTIENPMIWDSITQEYIVNYCCTKLKTEKVYGVNTYNSINSIEFLHVKNGLNNSSVDAKCLNLHPSIRDRRPNIINITNRFITANFDNGYIYYQFNSLPMIDNDVAIPIITTGAIQRFIENRVKWKLAEMLILRKVATSELQSFYNIWKQEDKILLHEAQTESKFHGLGTTWSREKHNKDVRNRINLNIRGGR